MELLMQKIRQLPASPGCYIFRNKRSEIIYIGKSKSLKNRVRQYFQNMDAKEGKYLRLTKEIVDVESILTDSETDALILECALIKKYQPKYNSQLKKNRVYPYIKINPNATYPAISISDKIEDDGFRYFGCFYGYNDAYQTVKLINRIWQTPLCCKSGFGNRDKPCFNYHLKKCCSPCGGIIQPEQYHCKVNEIIQCLMGKPQHIMRRLKREMKAASLALDFENAADLRDCIKELEQLSKKNKKLNTLLDDRDIYLFFRAFNEQSFSLFFIRNGRTLGSMRFESDVELNLQHLSIFVQESSFGDKSIDSKENYHLSMQADGFLYSSASAEKITEIVPGDTAGHISQYMKQDNKFLTVCLMDIFADKLYVPISSKMSHPKIVEALEKEYNDFVARGNKNPSSINYN